MSIQVAKAAGAHPLKGLNGEQTILKTEQLIGQDIGQAVTLASHVQSLALSPQDSGRFIAAFCRAILAQTLKESKKNDPLTKSNWATVESAVSLSEPLIANLNTLPEDIQVDAIFNLLLTTYCASSAWGPFDSDPLPAFKKICAGPLCARLSEKGLITLAEKILSRCKAGEAIMNSLQFLNFSCCSEPSKIAFAQRNIAYADIFMRALRIDSSQARLEIVIKWAETTFNPSIRLTKFGFDTHDSQMDCAKELINRGRWSIISRFLNADKHLLSLDDQLELIRLQYQRNPTHPTILADLAGVGDKYYLDAKCSMKNKTPGIFSGVKHGAHIIDDLLKMRIVKSICTDENLKRFDRNIRLTHILLYLTGIQFDDTETYGPQLQAIMAKVAKI